MEKKRRILFATLVALLLGTIAWIALRPNKPEPVYQGKSLSEWLAIYDRANTNITVDQAVAATKAINSIGTNAIPSLMRMWRTPDSRWKQWLVDLARKQSVVTIHYTPPSVVRQRGGFGLQMLGPSAKDIVPELIKMYDESRSPDSQREIAAVFGSIGPSAKAAVPCLVRGAVSSNEFLRTTAIRSLGEIHSSSSTVVPLLINALHDPAPLNRMFAAQALGEFGSDAKSAVPALSKIVASNPPSFPRIRFSPGALPHSLGDAAAGALEEIDPVAAKDADIE